MSESSRIYTQTIRVLNTRPFFWALVPVFFVWKNTNTYFTAITFRQSTELLAVYLAGACVCWLPFRVLLKTNYRAALCSFVLLTVYFFYGDFDQFLQAQHWLYPFNKYRWSLSALLLLLAGALYFIGRLKIAPTRSIRFLNLLMTGFCLSVLVPLVYKSLTPNEPLLSLDLGAPLFPGLDAEIPDLPSSDTTDLVSSIQHTLAASHPDIYFLLFDEYQGNAGLQKVFHYNNDGLKNALAAKGFFTPSMSRSNYNFTFFSMPSIFNMCYLQGEVQGKDRTDDLRKFSAGIDLIRNSQLILFLKAIQYTITDLSPFNLDDTATPVSQFQSIPVGKELIRSQTFFSVCAKKFGWMVTNRSLLRLLNPADYNNRFYNEYVREHLVAGSVAPRKAPRFVYAHLFLPHLPFLKDSSGNDLDLKEFVRKTEQLGREYQDERYLEYLKYANTVMINTVDSLINNDPGAVIVIMSDHGYRGLGPANKQWQYNNQFWLRTPERNYSGWPDTVDGVNAFRLILNKEFGQRLRYLPYRTKEFRIAGP